MKLIDAPSALAQSAWSIPVLRRSILKSLFLGFTCCAAVGFSLRAEPQVATEVAHAWKPMADWYRPDLRITKLAPRSLQHSEVRLQPGDDPQWAAPNWDDSTWAVIERTRVPVNTGIFWLRVRVRTTGERETVPSLVVIEGLPAWECYWDGVLATASGSPGSNRQAEISGKNSVKLELSPEMARSGEHVVAFRVSTYTAIKAGAGFAQLLLWTVPLKEARALDGRLNLLPAMGTGAMLTIGTAAALFWLLTDRRLILALFAALCVSSAALIVVASAPMMLIYPSSWGYFQSLGRVSLVVTVASLMLATLSAQLFPGWRRRWLLLPLVVEATIATSWLPLGPNGLLPILWRGAFIPGLALVVWAIWRRRPGARLVMAGLAATYVLFERDPKHFDNSNFVFAILPIVIGLIAAIALRLRKERLQARDTKLTAARLQIELLKKSLQPHFLMNTLTSLSQVIEEKPAAAGRLIEDLAAEFRSLARFSDQKQVLIAEELALCRAHLGVMSVRTNLSWNLEAEGIDETASIPPALFLTLIENGFSHQRARKDATTFRLRAERTGDRVRYVFVSPGVVTSETNRVVGGTGLRYVCARLEESFHDAWKLTQGAVPGGWETVIELFHARRLEADA